VKQNGRGTISAESSLRRDVRNIFFVLMESVVVPLLVAFPEIALISVSE
jgi:hypothetical protein